MASGNTIGNTSSDGEPQKVTRSEVIANIQQAFLNFLKANKIGSADDVRPLVEIPNHIHPSIVGVAFKQLKQDKLIRVARVGVSARSIAHGRIARFWRLTKSGSQK